MKIKSISGAVLYVSDKSTICETLEEAVAKGADLQYANLKGANLARANLKGANLARANLQYADLRNANLYGANLYGADLYEANLKGANLYGANLYEANLKCADLQRANLNGADLTGAKLWDANLTGADLTGADLTGADLKYATVNNTNLEGTLQEGTLWNDGNPNPPPKETETKEPHMKRTVSEFSKLKNDYLKARARLSRLALETSLAVKAFNKATLALDNYIPGGLKTVYLTSCASSNKIQIIKAIRQVTSLGLKESKDIADSAGPFCETGNTIITTTDRALIDRAVQLIREAGGITTIK